MAAALGGGSSVVGGTSGAVTAPNYLIQGTNYNNVGSALAALDGKTTSNFERTNAGIASAIAVATLPLDPIPGKVAVAAAVGSFNGHDGLAVGIGGVSADGNWRYSVTGSMSNAQGHTQGGGGVGVRRYFPW